MSFASKHNKGGVNWGIESIENYRFMKLEDAYMANGEEYVYILNGLYMNKKSSFGEHGVLIDTVHELLLDVPAHMNEELKNILKDETDIVDIKAGKVGFKIRTYEDGKYKKLCYAVTWVDLEPMEI